MKQLLKLSLLLLALLLPATAMAYDFQVGKIQYTITSGSTVKVSGQTYWDIHDNIIDHVSSEDPYYKYNITIPNHVTYNNVNYMVTEIGDSAFYCGPLYEEEDETKIFIDYDVSIPETVTFIGLNAFGGEFGIANVYCSAMTPPIMNAIVDQNHQNNFFLYVPFEAYTLYKELNDNLELFNAVYIINGERTSKPAYIERPLYQPVSLLDGPYGFDIKIYPSDNSVVYVRENYNCTGLLNHIVMGEWNRYESSDSICFHYEVYYDGGGRPDGWEVEFYAVEEGKNPSLTTSCGSLYGLDFKCPASYDFEDSGICYNLYPNSVGVTYQAFSYHPYENPYDDDVIYDEYIYYTGDVVIPSSVTFHDQYCVNGQYYNSYDTYPVMSIDNCAFMDCEDLNSITIPSSITTICHDAFYGCTGLTRVNITNLEAWCNIYFDISDGYFGWGTTNPLSNAHHLFLNGTEVTDLIIPTTVTQIRDFAFAGCTGLTSVSIPNTVSEIGEYAFIECAGLTSVIIPNSVTSIGYSVFQNCSGLTSVTIPKSVTIIDDGAFVDCIGLNEVYSYITDPSSISMGYDVFSREPNNYDVRTLYVPYGTLAAYQNDTRWSQYFGNIVEMEPEPDFVSDGAYYSITGDHEVVVSRGEEAYSGSMVIPESVTVDGETYTVTGIADGAFANANLDFLSIPVAITDNIASNAFDGSNINSVHIAGEGSWNDGALPASVETLYIGSGVTSVEGLQVNPATIYSYASVPPTCDGNTFTGYDATLHVPASSLAAYFTAPYWCNFINIIGDAVEPTELTFDNDSINVLVGNQIQLNATLVPNNATPSLITWTSSNDSIATVSNGSITAVGVGECDIKAMLLDKVAVCHVTVTEIAPTQITLSQEFAKLEVGSQLTLTATVLPEDATDKTVTWSTTNSAVASVDSQGNVMAIGPGECFITATCRDKQAMCHVIVVEHFINIQLDQHELLLLPNHIELLTPTVTPVSTDLAVTSTNPSVAAARLANGKIQVVGIAEGTTTIRVNSTDGYAEPDSCVVKVYTLRGDVNGDGFVNISDATLLISYLVAPSETIHQVNADTNNDGQINISDATRLISYLLTGEELEPKPDNEFETETITVNGVSFDMISVEGGTFMMGATPEQGDEALDKEKPVHRVTVSSFAMSQTEVTQELWQAVMGSNPSHFTGDPKRPVELVSWNDCQTFIAQLNQLTGKRFRLPTEAEWEYAARGGNRYKVTRYAGSNNIDEVAWYDANSGNTTHPVATKAPNELGLYDMTGNVWEWCQDWYALYCADDQTDPTGPETGNNRVLRGGCWNGGTNYDRISFRDNFRPSGSNSGGGLRLVLDQEVVYTVNGVSFTMVPVKGGTFTMGATEEEDADHATFVASPKHQVTLSNFSIGQTEVTQELWVAVMGSNPSQDTSNLQYPVSYINWPDCDAFITKLNELTGLHFRLPTEAEWEYAAKGGANSKGFVYSGSDDLDEVAWISTNSDSHPHQVATKKANELGLYDMNGNIEEWCHDWYSLYTEDPVVNPSGPETGMSKVHRGGRWNGSAKYCRLTRRDGFSQGVKRNYMGMRLAL